MSRQWRYKVRMMTAMEVGGKRYGTAKTAGLAIATRIAENIAMSVRSHERRSRTGENWYGQFKRLKKKAYRRIKAKVQKAFGDYDAG